MNFKLQIITPSGIYFDDEVESLTLKLSSGYRTILKGHTPLVGSLAYAPMHIVKDKKIEYFALHGGAINVKKDKVIVIANAVERSNEIDVDRAKAAKARAEDRLNKKGDPNLDVKRAELALERALVRIQTSEYH